MTIFSGKRAGETANETHEKRSYTSAERIIIKLKTKP